MSGQEYFQIGLPEAFLDSETKIRFMTSGTKVGGNSSPVYDLFEIDNLRITSQAVSETNLLITTKENALFSTANGDGVNGIDTWNKADTRLTC